MTIKQKYLPVIGLSMTLYRDYSIINQLRLHMKCMENSQIISAGTSLTSRRPNDVH